MKKQKSKNLWAKKNGDELQEYLQFRRRGSKVKPKKGKGSFKRKKKFGPIA